MLEKLLQKKEALYPVGTDEIQKQFYVYMYAILEAEKYAHYETAVEYLAAAIEQTMGNIQDTLKKMCVYPCRNYISCSCICTIICVQVQ